MQQPPRLQLSPQLGSQLLIFGGCSQATIYYKTQASAAPLKSPHFGWKSFDGP